MSNVDEEWYRQDRHFRIVGNDQYGYAIKACGNNRILTRDTPLKTLEEARNWLTYYYPGTKLYPL